MRQVTDSIDFAAVSSLAVANAGPVVCAGVTVGDAFRQALDALIRWHGSAASLQRETGLSSATLTRLRNGERFASADVLERLRRALQVQPFELFDPDRALLKLGLRRDTDSEKVPRAHVSEAVVEQGSPLPVSGGVAMPHPDPELLGALLGYWDSMDPDARFDVLAFARRRRQAGSSSASVKASVG